MKIIVNAIPITGLTTGISRCLRNMYQAMSRLNGVKVFYFNGNKVSQEMPPAARPKRWIKNASFIWKLPDLAVFVLRSVHWMRYEYLLQRAVRRGNFDLYHETAFVPARINLIPSVYTIYDLSLIQFRNKHPKERVWFHDFFFPRRIRYANHVLTISEFIKNEIHEILGLEPDRVTAVPLAPDPCFSLQKPEIVKKTLSALNLPEKYFLFVGSLEPRKNLGLIVEAMARQKDSVHLVLAGWKGWGDKSWLSQAPPALKKKIITPGYVDDHTLVSLYTGALGFIYPSLYEGFGLPVLEAMACGCPVICSDAASLPEVADDAAMYINPQDPDTLKHAMEKVSTDPKLRQDLRRRGLRRAACFSWKKTAEKTLELFNRWRG